MSGSLGLAVGEGDADAVGFGVEVALGVILGEEVEFEPPTVPGDGEVLKPATFRGEFAGDGENPTWPDAGTLGGEVGEGEGMLPRPNT